MVLGECQMGIEPAHVIAEAVAEVQAARFSIINNGEGAGPGQAQCHDVGANGNPSDVRRGLYPGQYPTDSMFTRPAGVE